MIILGIETSCDETSAALLKINPPAHKASARQGCNKFELLSHVTSSSVKQQAKYGGIVPEVAARKQIEYMIPALQETLKGVKPKKIEAIAVTVGPGLATSLQVGIDTAKALAYTWQKPLIPVNHLEGHLYSPLLQENTKLKFPAIGLVVSGGHTELILVKDYLKYKLVGRTRDDAAGEAFDKVAKLLGLGYPGGPIISKLAVSANSNKYNFPRGMIDSDNYDFSFSGLKTAVLYAVKKNKKMLTKKELPHVAASFEQAVIDVLVAKTFKATKKYKVKTLLVGGGVTANPSLREALERSCQIYSIDLHLSPLKFTGDNASMVAAAGYFRYQVGQYVIPNPSTVAWKKITAQPNLRLVK